MENEKIKVDHDAGTIAGCGKSIGTPERPHLCGQAYAAANAPGLCSKCMWGDDREFARQCQRAKRLKPGVYESSGEEILK